MIFASVGSQMPFDRLIRALDEWAENEVEKPDVLAQVGNTNFSPRNLRTIASMSPTAFRDAVMQSDLMIAHAGMGSVLTALEFGKPLVVLPRLGKLQETRNDHQVVTAKWLASRPGIFVAMDETNLSVAINNARLAGNRSQVVPPVASSELVLAVSAFIQAK